MQVSELVRTTSVPRGGDLARGGLSPGQGTTADDAVLTIRLMIFFELIDIDRNVLLFTVFVTGEISGASEDPCRHSGRRHHEPDDPGRGQPGQHPPRSIPSAERGLRRGGRVGRPVRRRVARRPRTVAALRVGGGAHHGLHRIAEGAGEFSLPDKQRFYRMATRSATETSAIVDILARRGHAPADQTTPIQDLIIRVVSMLTKLAAK